MSKTIIFIILGAAVLCGGREGVSIDRYTGEKYDKCVLKYESEDDHESYSCVIDSSALSDLLASKRVVLISHKMFQHVLTDNDRGIARHPIYVATYDKFSSKNVVDVNSEVDVHANTPVPSAKECTKWATPTQAVLVTPLQVIKANKKPVTNVFGTFLTVDEPHNDRSPRFGGSIDRIRI